MKTAKPSPKPTHRKARTPTDAALLAQMPAARNWCAWVERVEAAMSEMCAAIRAEPAGAPPFLFSDLIRIATTRRNTTRDTSDRAALARGMAFERTLARRQARKGGAR